MWTIPGGVGTTSGGVCTVISASIGTTPDPLVKTIRYVDPLILDLDGNGLQITALSKGILFDANGDTIKTATAWAGAGDGMLVWDKNGNGSIDSGQELFGDETILTNGPNAGKKAANGFAALADLDTGSLVNGVLVGAGDGVFDAKDAQYANLRIWRDLNQDGISQANELQTLQATGVQSINLASTTTNTNYGDAILAQSGSFTRIDSAGNTSTGQAGSFILAQNNFVRSFIPITVSTAAQALPNIQGSGWVRDLQEAATQSPQLVAALNAVRDAPTQAGYKSAMASLLRAWGNDSAYASASKQAAAAGYGLVLSDPIDDQERGWMDSAVKASEADRNTFRATLSQADLTKFDAMRERMVGGLEKVYAYEAFTGYTFLNWQQIQGDSINYVPRWLNGGGGGGVPVEVWVPLSQVILENRNAFVSSQAGYIRVNIPTPTSGMPHIEMLWDRLVQDATTNLMPSLRLGKYLDMVDLNISATGISYDFARLNAALAAANVTNAREGAALLLDVHHTFGKLLDGMGWNGVEQLRALTQLAITNADVRSAFGDTGSNLYSAASSTGTEGNDIFAGDASGNTFAAGGGNDILFGFDGNDTLSGGNGDDLIYGDAGNDNLQGGDGNDNLQGGLGVDSLDGGAGADMLDGGEGDDILNGMAGDDRLSGDAGDDNLHGGAGNDYLEGGIGHDQLFGEDGDDVLVGGSGVDSLIGGNGADTYKINLGASTVYIDNFDADAVGSKPDKLVFGEGIHAADVRIQRDAGGPGDKDVILILNGTSIRVVVSQFRATPTSAGSYVLDSVVFADGTTWDLQSKLAEAIEGDEVLSSLGNAMPVYGYGGNDTLIAAPIGWLNLPSVLVGGRGNDTYFINRSTDTVTELANEGIDTVVVSRVNGYTLGENLENIVIQNVINQPVDGISVYGNSLDNDIQGSDNDNYLSGEDGNDVLHGGGGNDYLYGGNGNDILSGDAGNDTLDGSEGADTYLFGRGSGYDWISDAEALSSTQAIDTLQFAADVFESDVTLTRNLNGYDFIYFQINNTTDQVTIRNYSDDISRFGIEAVKFGNGVEWNLATFAQKLQAIRDSDETLVDDSAARVLYGYGGNDALYGSSYGESNLYGGLGNDTYFVQNTMNTPIEAVGEGVDTVISSVNYTLGNNLENLTLGGINAINGTGNAADNFLLGNSEINILTGGAGNDTLDGGAGADKLLGGLGNDIYFVDAVGDVVTEALSEGTDTVVSALTWTLAANLENLILSGSANINATGNTLSNVLTGNAGDNLVNGGAGADTMLGGLGNDTYVVDNTADVVTENLNQGVDLVLSSVSYLLSANAENLTLTGTTAINGTGNALDNVLLGNSAINTLTGGAGNDVLDGGAGADKLLGGLGNDTYVIDNASDLITENLNEGTDLVRSSVTHSLAANVENLTLTGTTAINGTGNALDNVLVGNSAINTLTGGAGNDTLNGGAGADKLLGGLGNDTYVVDNVGDLVTENLNEGTDLVQSSVAYTLAANVENLTLTGATAINGTGNAANNILTGNNAANTLTGAAGNDTLDGGAGADSLVGGVGNDTYLLGRGYGVDTITENDATAGNTDLARFGAGITTDQLWFTKVGNNLEVSIIGTTDKFTINSWYVGSQNHVEQFKTSDGKTLLDSQVQNLVNAMAVFAPPAAGQTTLPANYATTLAPVLAANWV